MAARRAADLLQENVLVILVLCAAAALEVVLSRSAIASDAWYTLLGGRTIAHGGLPHHDSLTVFAHGRTWVDQQWLGHLILYGLWSLGGWPLASLAIVAAYAGSMMLGAACARSLGASERSVSLMLLVWFLVGLPNTALRAQVLVYPLFSLVFLLLLADERRPSRRVLLVFPLLVVWANVHGSVVVGAALVSLYGVTRAVAALRARVGARELWRPALLLLGPLACAFASPYALDLPGYYQRTLVNPSFGRLVVEWTPSTIRNQPIFFAGLALALWLSLSRSRALGPLARLALPLSAIGGLVAIRNIVWFALVAIAVLPRALDAAWTPRLAPRRKTLNLALVAAASLGLAVTAAATASRGRAWFEHDFPARAGDVVAAAAANPGVRVFANERYADWLLFEHPALRGKVAYDIRFELLTSRQLQSIFDFNSQHGANWQRAAGGYDVLVLDRADQKPQISYYVGRAHARWLYRDRSLAVLELPSKPRP